MEGKKELVVLWGLQEVSEPIYLELVQLDFRGQIGLGTV